MTDFFALLEQPRLPWLDPVALKESYHRKTLQSHPDATADGGQENFSQVNEAYQVLLDPKRRLHHLLSLAGAPPAPATQVIPQELQELFLLIGELNQRAHPLIEKRNASSNALSRSLLQPQITDIARQVGELRARVGQMLEAAANELRDMNPKWQMDGAQPVSELSNLYSTFSYLGRWSAQLDELAFQLPL